MAKEFSFIKGACSPDCPADICFYTDVDYWSVDSFLNEFDWLVNVIRPSKIRIHINSIGGSVVDGMSVFSKIIDCQIPTECINDSLAASMGSIIWAAGDELYMKDYALLMIHNPFCDKCGEKEYNQVTEAVTQQLKTIYMKRFGLSEEEAQAIMDGKDGDDGTFLTAQQAVERGFLKADHIIETPKAIRDQVSAAIDGVKDLAKIKAVFSLLGANESEQAYKQNTQINSNKMDNNDINVLAALFGMTGELSTTENVSAKINELKAEAEKAKETMKELDETKAQLTRVEAELAGANTSVKNLTEDLEKTKATLQVYEEAEAKAKADRVNALIDQAIVDCKIDKEERDIYAKIAENDYDLAVNILAKIPARDNLSQVVAVANKETAQEGMKSTQQELDEKVSTVVGKNFTFRSLK